VFPTYSPSLQTITPTNSPTELLGDSPAGDSTVVTNPTESSGALITGIVLGCLCVVVLLGGLIFYRQHRNKDGSAMDTTWIGNTHTTTSGETEFGEGGGEIEM